MDNFVRILRHMLNTKVSFSTPDDAIAPIQSGMRVFVHGSAATPLTLLNALQNQYERLSNVELVSISTLGDLPFNRESLNGHFYLNSLFVSANVREWVNQDYGDYTPVFMSEIPRMFRQGVLALDAALLHVSPPDQNGYCSLGCSVDIAKAAADTAPILIAQINPKMPRVHGDGFIHISKFTAICECEDDLPEISYTTKANEVYDKIGRNVAELVENGSILQLGIGVIPDLVLQHLSGHQHLGLHTEMFSDGVIPLLESGVIDNSTKRKHSGKTVTGFILGSRKVYDFVHDNPSVNALDIGYVNDASVIRQYSKMTSINSALEIDLTGQVCADSLGTYQFSGIGGQMDFIRGASLSEGGKPIIALPSLSSKGQSRISPILNQGAGVVTTRGHIHWVVTEYGSVNLYGMSLKQRAKALIEIAHPAHRAHLENAWFDRQKGRVAKK